MKKLYRIGLAACLAVMLMGTAHAYLDPSVMTYTIQVVAGVVVAVGAVAGIYWRKAKKKVQDKLGIDENAKKSVEDDVIETDGEQ
jgi:Na+/proline symporter